MNLSQRQRQHHKVKSAFQQFKKIKVIIWNFCRKEIIYIETICRKYFFL